MNEQKHTKRYRIEKTDAGMPVSVYLHKKVGFTKRQISRMKFRENGICLNGVRMRTTTILKPGDELQVRLSGEEARKEVRKETRWFPPSPDLPPLRVLYEDEDLLIVYKPAGVVCHPGKGHFSDTLMNQAAWYLAENVWRKKDRKRGNKALDNLFSAAEASGIPAELHLVGRLDRDTSGIVVFARSREAAQRLWKQREDGVFVKTYLACVQGCFSGVSAAACKERDPLNRHGHTQPESTGEILQGQKRWNSQNHEHGQDRGQDQNQRHGQFLDKMDTDIRFSYDPARKRGHIIAPIGRRTDGLHQMEIQPDGKEAETFFQIIREEEDSTLLEVRIHHGRTHQIRVHMAGIGHPLEGDILYGSGIVAKESENQEEKNTDEEHLNAGTGRREMELCAYKVKLRAPFGNDTIRVECSRPQWTKPLSAGNIRPQRS